MADIVRRIKTETPLAVTLSLGERPDRELAAWRAAGADRYCCGLKPPTATLFDEIHPPLGERTCDRMAMLRRLKGLGYEMGSGIMVGIPGQTYESVARRHLPVPRTGPGHDRHRAVHPASGHAAGQRFQRVPAGQRRAGAQQRIDGLQGGGPDPAGAARREHPQHHRAGHHQQEATAASWACSAAPTCSCPTSRR